MPLFDLRNYRRKPRNNAKAAASIADALLRNRNWPAKLIIVAAIVLALALTGISAPGKKVIGIASIIDGDTIEIQGMRIRLFGIDAPESKQICNKDGADYACGRDATFALSDMIGTKTVECEQKDVDRYQRIVAVCSVDGTDLNGWMVTEGQARAFLRYSYRYLLNEMKARFAQRGIWSGEFENPWDYRRNR